MVYTKFILMIEHLSREVEFQLEVVHLLWRGLAYSIMFVTKKRYNILKQMQLD